MNARTSFRLFVCSLFVLALAARVDAEISELWGNNGERWNPQSRLPDFSYAGYHCGEAPLPEVSQGVSVKKFGARGDGTTDASAAFIQAIATVTNGAIEIPPGRYVLSNLLEIRRSGVVLRGASPDKTLLLFRRPLNEIKPNTARANPETGTPISFYSWYGGLVWFKGSYDHHELATITSAARRGEQTVHVSNSGDLHVGQRIEISVTDSSQNSLASNLYANDPGDISRLKGSVAVMFVCRITHINGDQIQFDRPLRIDIKPEWKPCVRSYEPTVSESGIENLSIEFPVTKYQRHFAEAGYNALAFSQVSDCWARNLRIVNADSGIFVDARFCSIQGLVIESMRGTDATFGATGHHGVYFYSDDNLLTDFNFKTQFIHDLSINNCGGNVIAHGRGIDLCFDHHCRAPYENLFTDIDAGAGTHLWRASGGPGLGKHCGARETFWNIRSTRPQSFPPPDFSPSLINLIAVQTDLVSERNATGRWFEAISPKEIIPQDIHAAQLARRLKERSDESR